MEGLIKAGLDAHIPVINSDAASCIRGSIAGVGISFYESGYAAGDLVARILLGEDPGTIPFQELQVIRRGANLNVAKQLDLGFSDKFLADCGVFHGVATRFGRPANVAYVQLIESKSLDSAKQGVSDGFSAAGLIEDQDIKIHEFNAQGDLAQLPQIFQAVITSSPDLIVTCTTPTMIAAAHTTSEIPIAFTVVSDPSAVGVSLPEKRQKNLTGVYDDPPIAQLLDLAESHEGRIRSVGTIWNPAEPNSEISVKRLRDICRQRGIELTERNASSTNELADVARAVCSEQIDILVILADNVATAGFSTIHSVAKQQKIPIYCTEPDLVQAGAAGAVGVDYYDWGRQTALLAARILAGQTIESIVPEKVSSVRTVTPIAKSQ